MSLSDKILEGKKYGGMDFIQTKDVKQFIEELKRDMVLRVDKYGLDFCHNIFIKHIDELAGEGLI